MPLASARWSSRAGPVAVVLAFVSCGVGEGGDVGSTFARTDSAGVELFVTRPGETSPESGWRIGPEPAVEFGAAEEPAVEFFRVNGVARLASGRVAVLDYGDKLLRVFEPEGALAFTVGGEGDGPGEFRGPWGPIVLAGDTILVYDQRHRRFSLFSPDGRFVRDQRLEAPPLDGAELSQYAPEDAVGDTVLMIPTAWAIRMNDEAGRFTMRVPMLRYRLDGSYLSEMAEPTTMELERRGTSVGVVVFARPTRAFARSGQIYVVDPARYEIRVYPHDGELARVYRLDRPLRATTDADVEAYIEHQLESAEGEGAEERIRDHYENTARADSFPALDYARVDGSGNIWVHEYRPPWETHEGSRWTVFGADGRWLGSIDVPSRFRPDFVGDGTALGVLTDELGVERVVAYAVRPGTGTD